MLARAASSAKPGLTMASRATSSVLNNLLVPSVQQPRASSTMTVAAPFRRDYRPLASLCLPLPMTRRFSDASPISEKTDKSPIYSTVHHQISDGSDDDKFAIVAVAGSQYKVTQDDVLVVTKIKDAEVGQPYVLDKVLLTGTKNETSVGRPLVPGAKVIAFVEEQTLDKKVIIFKKKRRKHHKKTRGYRRELTVLRIQSIEGP